MVDSDSLGTDEKMKQILSFNDSESRTSTNFSVKHSNDLSKPSRNKKDGRNKDLLKPLKRQNGINRKSFSELGPPEDWYYLPRSSPVISRKTHIQTGHEMEAQALEASHPLSFPVTSVPNIPGLSPNTSGLSEKQVPPSENKEGESPTSDDEAETVSISSSESWVLCEYPPDTADQTRIRGLSLSEWMTLDTKPGNKSRSYTDVTSVHVNEKNITEGFYRLNEELDQENAHFVVVDMVLEVMENMKWTVYEQDQHFDNTQNKDPHFQTYSFSSEDSGYEDLCDQHVSGEGSVQISVSSFQKDSECSAEGLARQLLMGFRKQWLISDQLSSCDKQSLSLEEFPLDSTPTGSRVSLSEEIIQRSRMRGTLTWAPPRFQIIFNVQPTHRRRDIIASQHFLCAGCGTEVEPRYMKRLRYCDYLGRYFCDGCHGGAESIIPGRVLCHWDFGRYLVCVFSKQILNSIWEQPLFKLTSVAKNLYKQAKELQKFRELQDQLITVKKLLRACRLSDGILAEFQQLPTYLSEELHLFSMDDLVKVKRGHLINTVKALLRLAIGHVETCQLCQANGFICEFCHGQDVIFTFQTDKCTRCPGCKACFHTICFKDESCPRCARLQMRKILHNDHSF